MPPEDPQPTERPVRFQPPDGPALHGVTWGSPGPVCLFTPGNGFTAQAYVPALEPLAARGFVHGLNPRGHGGGAPPAPFANWDGFLADLRAYVEQRLTPPVLLVGHSFGAVLSLRLAAEAPHLVRGLVLMDPLVRGRREEPWPTPATLAAEERELIERTRNRRERWPDRAEAEASLRGGGGYRFWDEEPLSRFLASGLLQENGPGGSGDVSLACPAWLEANIYETLPGKELFDWAEQVRVPTAILRGESSQYVSAEGIEQLADALPVAAVYRVKGTHTFPLEHPGHAARALAAGLRMVLQEGAPPS